MTPDWINSQHCHSRAHCRTCLTDGDWRQRVGAPEVCPHGVTMSALPAPVVSVKRKPIEPTPEQRALIAARKAICEACPEAQRITDRGVDCRDCGCGLVSFIHGKCKLNKWPDGPGGS